MSIFINSKVHLPSSCEKCPFNYADMSAGICMAADKTIDTRTYGRKRHPDCPLTELPTPHGRLVDAERFRIPMKATIKSESFKGRQLSVGYFCPKCHKPVHIRHLYCYECGQAIDWGDCS